MRDVGAAAMERRSPRPSAASAMRSARSGLTGCAMETCAAQPVAEEALLAREGAVDELVDDHERARAAGPRAASRTADSETMSVTPARFSASMLAR